MNRIILIAALSACTTTQEPTGRTCPEFTASIAQVSGGTATIVVRMPAPVRYGEVAVYSLDNPVDGEVAPELVPVGEGFEDVTLHAPAADLHDLTVVYVPYDGSPGCTADLEP